MRAAALATVLAAVVVFGCLAAGGAAVAACSTPTPNPSQTSSGIELQIGDPTPTPTDTCAPSASPSVSSGAGSGLVSTSGGGRPSRGTAPAAAITPQTAAAGAAGAPVPGAQPVPKADPLTLTPARVRAGDKVQATGKGYMPGEQVQFVLYPTPVIIGSYTADANGVISTTFTVPVDTKTGPRTIEATGWVSHHASNGVLVVVTAVAAIGPISSTWWLIGIGILLLLLLIVSLVVFRSNIARLFGQAGLPEVAS
ncbi:hypothetical protein [Lacisediminihabitans sp. H27-G8]|uniref:hypothetical protein n=1 Tax=Lacisediminihabitans sp. H27-G8 TaxID=3111909 RepID=UPI0038FC38AE